MSDAEEGRECAQAGGEEEGVQRGAGEPVCVREAGEHEEAQEEKAPVEVSGHRHKFEKLTDFASSGSGRVYVWAGCRCGVRRVQTVERERVVHTRYVRR